MILQFDNFFTSVYEWYDSTSRDKIFTYYAAAVIVVKQYFLK